MGEHLLREHRSGYSSNLKKSSANIVGSYLGEHLLREPCLQYSLNCDEAMFGVLKASLNMFREYLSSSANFASDWLRAKRALLWMRKKKKRCGVDTSFVSN